jgi:hypothetical protein
VSACLGDDVNYDYNAFAASLAVAIANELGRWEHDERRWPVLLLQRCPEEVRQVGV